jgi:hypothetical protein
MISATTELNGGWLMPLGLFDIRVNYAWLNFVAFLLVLYTQYKSKTMIIANRIASHSLKPFKRPINGLWMGGWYRYAWTDPLISYNEVA